MLWLVIGLILFLGAHSASIVAAAWRDAMAARLGHGWRGLFALVSIAGFVLIIYGYGVARMTPTILYVPPLWLRYVAVFLMLFVFPLLLATYLPGRIKRAAKHPMLAATKLWATAHLLANGMLADVTLFGAFLIWAVADRISLKRRAPRPIATAPATPANDAIAVLGGLAIYATFVLWLHARLFGVQVPIPL
jgi:uncharacterized membrane protein